MTQQSLDKILATAAEPERGREDFKRFEEVYRTHLGKELDTSTPGARQVARVFGNSSVLTHRLLAHPSWFDHLANTPYLTTPKPKDLFHQELDNLFAGATPTTESFMAGLRQYKYQELARIAIRDLAALGSEEEILAEWSDCADALLGAAYRRSYEHLAQRHGTPTDQATQTPCLGVVIALGKLGGRELNISSDVDLLMLYATDNGNTIGNEAGTITNHEFFVKLTSLFTRLLATVTDEGFVFRVDHELRPEGPQGALANSLDAAERYYEYFGRDWERQALIRARPVAGDLATGQAFLDAVRPFVFRRSMTLADLAHLREMKSAMERASNRRSECYDLKHGAGGIRDIEFLTQALIQLFGGTHPSVRCGNTFAALRALASEGLMHPFGASSLAEAYAFLRRAENMLQLAEEVQTHRLPVNRESLEILAKRMGRLDKRHVFDANRFLEELTRHTTTAEQLFAALFEEDYERQELVNAIRDNAIRATNEEEAVDSLAWFKQQEVRRIRELDLGRNMPLTRVLHRLTLCAEAVLTQAYTMARDRLLARHGLPRHEDGSPAHFAIVGLGSLGAGEIDYSSDLDVIFLYSGHGTTDGDRPISNAEFFTRLAQRTISLITMPGRYGKAYLVDSELRPSGNAGSLVATIESFKHYHLNDAQLWERLSLLKARVITGDSGFITPCQQLVSDLAFARPIAELTTARTEIVELRNRTLEERVGTTTPGIHLKLGVGGLTDLETILRYTQLTHAQVYAALRVQNSFALLNALSREGIFEPATCEHLREQYFFLRKIISRIRLLTNTALDHFEVAAPYAAQLATELGFSSSEMLQQELQRHVKTTAALFSALFVSPTP